MEWFLRLLELIIKFSFKITSFFKIFFKCERIAMPRELLENLPQCLTFSVKELQRALQNRTLSSTELVTAYIHQIEKVNEYINAVVADRFKKAIEEATNADELLNSINGLEERISLYENRPLFGIPFTIKESIGMAGMPFAVGSLLRKGKICDQDGTAVMLLRKAGGIPLLVSATSEYCYSIETNTLVLGACRNPHDLSCMAGGSSGGEAALNAAKAAPFGIGSDLAGSIRLPCLFTGIYGHKPTGGIINGNGHFPNSQQSNFKQMLQIGPMSRFVENLKIITAILASDSLPQLQLCKELHVQNMRIYYAYGFSGLNGLCHRSVSPHIRRGMVAMVDFLTARGLNVQPFNCSIFKNSLEISLSSMSMLEDLPFLMDLQKNNYPLFWTIIEFMKSLITPTKSNYTSVALNFDLLRRANSFMSKSSFPKYVDEVQHVRENLTQLLGQDGILIFPTFDMAAPDISSTLLHTWSVDYLLLFNVLGLPATHIPKFLPDYHLPVGFSVIAAPYMDRLCFEFAEYCQRTDADFLATLQEGRVVNLSRTEQKV